DLLSDSTMAGSTSRNPTMVLRTMGSSPYITKASTTERHPRPRPGTATNNTNKASDGIVTNVDVIANTTSRGRSRRYVSTPSATPTNVAINTDTTMTQMLSNARLRRSCHRNCT